MARLSDTGEEYGGKNGFWITNDGTRGPRSNIVRQHSVGPRDCPQMMFRSHPNLKSPRKPLAEYTAAPIYHQGRLSAPARNLLSGSSFLLAWTKSFMNLGPVTCALLNRTPAVMSFSFKSSAKVWLRSKPAGGLFKDSPSIFNPFSLTRLQASGRDTIALRPFLRVGGSGCHMPAPANLSPGAR